MKLTIPEEELLVPGNLSCQGCGATLALRYTLKALGKKTILCVPACCSTVIDGPFPYTSVKVPLLHCAFETAASTASGIKAGLEAQGDYETNVVAWAGDGGTFDIGIQALSGVVERGDNIFFICYDNEAYMNTGGQRSSATPWKAITTTTPEKYPKETPKKNIDEILAGHPVPYMATASIAFPEDFIKKVNKGKQIKGTKFFHILAPCPTGWRSPPGICVKLARLAVQTRLFPLYEVENGVNYRITLNPKPLPVYEYIKLQGRFRPLTPEDIKIVQENIDRNWELLVKKTKLKNIPISP